MKLTNRTRAGLIAFVSFDLLLLIVLASLFVVRSERNTTAQLRELGATVYPEAIELDSFQLTDQRGNSYSKEDLSGHWTLVFFGYTSCPDICPLTMAELRQYYEGLNDGDLKQDLRIVMVSVDPLRDSPETMGAYVESFNPDFIGLSGDHDAISKLAAQFFVGYSDASPHASHNVPGNVADNDKANSKLIEHSGHIAVVNPAGQYIAVLRAPHRDQDIARVLQTITGK